MILDEFGRPVTRGNTLQTPEWLKGEIRRIAEEREADWRAYALSVGQFEVGKTIQVKLPSRFVRKV